jgi:LysR family transcriptional regulator, cys regulon transcriptional activator
MDFQTSILLRMTLTQLRYFAAIVDAGLNITLAAERVHATQPGLSKQLKLLEEGLGFQLFARSGRSLEALTADGEFVLRHAREALSAATHIKQFSANARREQSGALTVLTTPMQARYILPQPVRRLRERYPDVRVHLRSASEHQVLPRLRELDADLAIVSTTHGPPSEGLAIALYRWRRVGVVPKNHPLGHLSAVGMAQLATHSLISYESSDRPDSSLSRAFAAHGLNARIDLTATESDLIKDYARRGLGVGIMAEMAGHDGAADLHYFALPDAIPTVTCYAVLPPDRVLRSYALDLLTDIAPQLDRVAVSRAVTGAAPYAAPTPPSWLELKQSFSI